jgi:hypothetical protein
VTQTTRSRWSHPLRALHPAACEYHDAASRRCSLGPLHALRSLRSAGLRPSVPSRKMRGPTASVPAAACARRGLWLAQAGREHALGRHGRS